MQNEEQQHESKTTIVRDRNERLTGKSGCYDCHCTFPEKKVKDHETGTVHTEIQKFEIRVWGIANRPLAVDVCERCFVERMAQPGTAVRIAIGKLDDDSRKKAVEIKRNMQRGKEFKNAEAVA